jgi:UDP:flavonoid glycosyltransferase YjiC (YdhE family)
LTIDGHNEPSGGPARRSKRKVVLVTVGSLGDLHPFLALGLALKARGIDALLATEAEYRDKVGAAGLAFAPVRPSFVDIERALGMSRTALTAKVVAHTEFLLTRAVLPFLRASYEDLYELCADAALVVTSSLAFGARLAAEKRGIPWMGVVLQPMMFLSAYDPPVIPKIEWLSGVLRALGPRATKRLYDAAKFASSGMFGPLARLRAELGLPPERGSPLFEGQFSTAGTLGLYTPLLGGVQPDYPAAARVVGFAAYDSEDGRAHPLNPALEHFLQAGSAPLVFTLGSLIVNSPGAFYRDSVLAARRLGRRAVLLVGDAGREAGAALAAADVFVASYAPHSLLFPRSAVVIHHGGIGTSSHALRAGVPQLVVPFFADQMDNAARIVRLGVGRSVTARRYRPASAVAELAVLIAEPSHAVRAAAAAAAMQGEDGAAAAATLILERLGAS